MYLVRPPCPLASPCGPRWRCVCGWGWGWWRCIVMEGKIKHCLVGVWSRHVTSPSELNKTQNFVVDLPTWCYIIKIYLTSELILNKYNTTVYIIIDHIIGCCIGSVQILLRIWLDLDLTELIRSGSSEQIWSENFWVVWLAMAGKLNLKILIRSDQIWAILTRSDQILWGTVKTSHQEGVVPPRPFLSMQCNTTRGAHPSSSLPFNTTQGETRRRAHPSLSFRREWTGTGRVQPLPVGFGHVLTRMGRVHPSPFLFGQEQGEFPLLCNAAQWGRDTPCHIFDTTAPCCFLK